VAIYPGSEQIRQLLDSKEEGPVVMINLLRFKPRSDDGSMTGEQAYSLYADAMIPLVESRGGRMIWMGRITSQVIGQGGDGFHTAALVEYPSRKAFVEIAMSPEVAAIAANRAAGLEMQWLLAATTG
jgi:uncharacterized protein (DUF1330 family)